MTGYTPKTAEDYRFDMAVTNGRPFRPDTPTVEELDEIDHLHALEADEPAGPRPFAPLVEEDALVVTDHAREYARHIAAGDQS